MVVVGKKWYIIAISVGLSLTLTIIDIRTNLETGRGVSATLYCAVVNCKYFSHAPLLERRSEESNSTTTSSNTNPLYVGVYGSNYGPVSITDRGGTYEPNGYFNQVIVSDDVMSGKWQNTPTLFQQTCGNTGLYEGRFRLAFDSEGFRGAWSRCDGPLNLVWNGWRPKPVVFYNTCEYPVDLAMRWTNEHGSNQSDGVWLVPAQQKVRLWSSINGLSQQYFTTASAAFVYIVNHLTGQVVFTGPSDIAVRGTVLPMYSINGEIDSDGMTFLPNCNNTTGNSDNSSG